MTSGAPPSTGGPLGMSSLRRVEVRALLPAEVLVSVEEALDLLPGARSEVTAWLVDHVPCRSEVAGVRLVRWGDVVDALAGSGHSDRSTAGAEDGGLLGPDAVAELVGISRRTLTRILGELRIEAPHLLPLRVGSGQNRHRYRWRRDEVESWWREVQAWRASMSEKTGASRSAGATPTAERGPESSRRGSASPTSSSPRSKRGSREDSLVSLRERVRSKRKKR